MGSPCFPTSHGQDLPLSPPQRLKEIMGGGGGGAEGGEQRDWSMTWEDSNESVQSRDSGFARVLRDQCLGRVASTLKT